MSQETQRIIGVLFGAHCPKGGGGGSGWREIEEENQRRSMVGIPDPRSPSKKKIYLTEDRGCLFSLNKTDLLRHHDKVETKGKQVTSKAIKTGFFFTSLFLHLGFVIQRVILWFLMFIR